MADGGDGVVPTTVTDYEGILDEVLARLPVKSLMRFRCVCKSWCALISSSQFASKHFDYGAKGVTKTTSRLLTSMKHVESVDHEALMDLAEGEAHLPIRKLDFPVMFPDSRASRIIGSCNGLICVKSDRDDIALWNPCTGSYNLLPRSSNHWTSQFSGFGYDDSSDDYKVMRGHCGSGFRESGETVVDVFSLKRGSWKSHEGLSCVNIRRRGCLVNGALHWLENIPAGSRIISFDLGEEKFQESTISLPYLAWFTHILTLGDCLSVYTINFLSNGVSGMEIWMMKEYGVVESWTRAECWDKSVERNGTSISLLIPLCILENNEILMVKEDYRSLVLYSSGDGTCKNVTRLGYDLNIDPVVHKETLVSPLTSSVIKSSS